MKKNTYLCKTKLHAMHTAKANSITIEPLTFAGGTEPVYYFHSDHLGSASWITNGSGLPVQHLLYLPFGEHFVNEHSSGYNERFSFTGKERDAETGYYYHGARFNSSDIGWLSVDPLSDKYPSLTPYNYCAWNPVKLVDPEGEVIKDPPANLKYTIQNGDNYWNLETEWNLPHGTLRDINPSIEPKKLQIGQEINAAKMEGGLIIVGDDVIIPEGREKEPPNEEGPIGIVLISSSVDFLQFEMAFEALLPSMGSFLPVNSLRCTKGVSNVNKLLQRVNSGKGFLGIGKSTYAEAIEAGKKWVGNGYRISSDKKAWISADGKRQFRPPSYKPRLGKTQANFESRTINRGMWENNGHLDITN
ncbi:MAG: hypothetical protein IJT04_07585 [Bacteroidales bacterium]|nr:hypothetical protein [Bacteroidales bacterium]